MRTPFTSTWLIALPLVTPRRDAGHIGRSLPLRLALP